MNYGENMPDWHQYNQSQSAGIEVSSVPQNVNPSHLFGPGIGPRGHNGINVSPNGISKSHNEATFSPRNLRVSPNTANGPNSCNENSSLGPMAQAPSCIGPYSHTPTSRNPTMETLHSLIDARSSNTSSLNGAIGHRGGQMLNGPMVHANGVNMSASSSLGSMGPRNPSMSPMPSSRQAPYVPCKGPCCNADVNVGYQSWDKFSPYPPNVYRENITQSAYPTDNRRFPNDFSFRKDNFENKETLGPGAPFTINPQRNFPDYKYRKDSMIPRNYVHPPGLLQNYPVQNYNFTGDYQKYPYAVKELPRENAMAPQNPAILKYQEQSVIVQERYTTKQIQYQNGSMLQKGMVAPNVGGGNVVSRAQNPYFSPHIVRDLPRDFNRVFQDNVDANVITNRLQAPIHSTYPKYQEYQQKIAFQKFSIENHLRELTRIPGYQRHPKYQECVLRYKELLRLQQTVEYQSPVPEVPRVVTTPTNEEIPPINLQFDQNGVLINSSYLPGGFSGLQSSTNTTASAENLHNVVNRSREIIESGNQGPPVPEDFTTRLHGEEASQPAQQEAYQNQDPFSSQKNFNEREFPVERYDEKSYNVTDSDKDKTENRRNSKEFADKPELDVRQFLANWDESEEEDLSSTNLPDVVLSNSASVVVVECENTRIISKSPENVEHVEQTLNSYDDEGLQRDENKEESTNDAQDYSTKALESEAGRFLKGDAEVSPLQNEADGIEKLACSDDVLPVVDKSERPTAMEKMQGEFHDANASCVDLSLHVDDISVEETTVQRPIADSVFEKSENIGSQSIHDADEHTDETETESSSDDSDESEESSLKESLQKSPEIIHGDEIHANVQELVTDLSMSAKGNLISMESSNLKKQSSFTSEESHNPDDISLPDLPTSECTPISTTLNTPIHSDSEDSSEHVVDPTIPANPIEIIQNSPMLSFAHSPMKMEPYEHLDDEGKSPDSLDFDFNEDELCENDQSSECVLANRKETKIDEATELSVVQHEGDDLTSIHFPVGRECANQSTDSNIHSSTFFDNKHTTTGEKNHYETSDAMENVHNNEKPIEIIHPNFTQMNPKEEATKLNKKNDRSIVEFDEKPVEHSDTQTSTLDDKLNGNIGRGAPLIMDMKENKLADCNRDVNFDRRQYDECHSTTEKNAFHSAEDNDKFYSSTQNHEKICFDSALNRSNFSNTPTIIPLIPGEDFEEPKMPVSPMEENCLTTVMKDTLPITNLDVLGSDEENMNEMDDIWMQVNCMTKDLDENLTVDRARKSLQEKSLRLKKLKKLEETSREHFKDARSFDIVETDIKRISKAERHKPNSNIKDRPVPKNLTNSTLSNSTLKFEDPQKIAINDNDKSFAVSQDHDTMKETDFDKKFAQKWKSNSKSDKCSTVYKDSERVQETVKGKGNYINNIATKLLENARFFEPEIKKMNELANSDNDRNGSKERIKLLKEFRKKRIVKSTITNQAQEEASNKTLKPESKTNAKIEPLENIAKECTNAEPSLTIFKKITADISSLGPKDSNSTNLLNSSSEKEVKGDSVPEKCSSLDDIANNSSQFSNTCKHVEEDNSSTSHIYRNVDCNHEIESTIVELQTKDNKVHTEVAITAGRNFEGNSFCLNDSMNNEIKLEKRVENNPIVDEKIEPVLSQTGSDNTAAEDKAPQEKSIENNYITNKESETELLEMTGGAATPKEKSLQDKSEENKYTDNEGVHNQSSGLKDNSAIPTQKPLERKPIEICSETNNHLRIEEYSSEIVEGNEECTLARGNADTSYCESANNKFRTDDSNELRHWTDNVIEAGNEIKGSVICSQLATDIESRSNTEEEEHQKEDIESQCAYKVPFIHKSPADSREVLHKETQETKNHEENENNFCEALTKDQNVMNKVPDYEESVKAAEVTDISSKSIEEKICEERCVPMQAEYADFTRNSAYLQDDQETIENCTRDKSIETTDKCSKSEKQESKPIKPKASSLETYLLDLPSGLECSKVVKQISRNTDEENVLSFDIKSNNSQSNTISLKNSNSLKIQNFDEIDIRPLNDENAADSKVEPLGLANSVDFDFNNFDVAPNEGSDADVAVNSWKHSKTNFRYEDCEKFKNPDGYVNPVFTSLDSLENLNTVPVYTTKDGKITYSPNPKFTYRALIMEAREREGYPVFPRDLRYGKLDQREPLEYPKSRDLQENRYSATSSRKRKHAETVFSKTMSYSKFHAKRSNSSKYRSDKFRSRSRNRNVSKFDRFSVDMDESKRTEGERLLDNMDRRRSSRDDSSCGFNDGDVNPSGATVFPGERNECWEEAVRRYSFRESRRYSVKSITDDSFVDRGEQFDSPFENNNCESQWNMSEEQWNVNHNEFFKEEAKDKNQQDSSKKSDAVISPFELSSMDNIRETARESLSKDCNIEPFNNLETDERMTVNINSINTPARQLPNDISEAPSSNENKSETNDTKNNTLGVSESVASSNSREYTSLQSTDEAIVKVQEERFVENETLKSAVSMELELNDADNTKVVIADDAYQEKKNFFLETEKVEDKEETNIDSGETCKSTPKGERDLNYIPHESLIGEIGTVAKEKKVTGSNEDTPRDERDVRSKEDAVLINIVHKETHCNTNKRESKELETIEDDQVDESSINLSCTAHSPISSDYAPNPKTQYHLDRKSIDAEKENSTCAQTNDEDLHNLKEETIVAIKLSDLSKNKSGHNTENDLHSQETERSSSEEKTLQPSESNVSNNNSVELSAEEGCTSNATSSSVSMDASKAEIHSNEDHIDDEKTEKRSQSNGKKTTVEDCRLVTEEISRTPRQYDPEYTTAYLPSTDNDNNKTVPKLVIKKSDASSKISTNTISPSVETEVENATSDKDESSPKHASYPKIPRMIIRNARSRPATPTIEEVVETSVSPKATSKEEHKIFKVKIKMEEKVVQSKPVNNSSKEIPSSETKIPKMTIKLDDRSSKTIAKDKSNEEHKNITDPPKTVPKMKIKKVRSTLSKIVDESSSISSTAGSGKRPRTIFEVNSESKESFSADREAVKISAELDIEKDADISTVGTGSKKEKIPKLKIKKQGQTGPVNGHSEAQMITRKRSYSNYTQVSHKRQRKISKEDTRRSGRHGDADYEDVTERSVDQNRSRPIVSEKIPKVIIKRTSSSDEFKCELSKNAEHAIIKNKMWQPEVKLQRSWLLDSIAQELQFKGTDSIIAKTSFEQNKGDWAKILCNNVCRKNLVRSSSASDLTPIRKILRSHSVSDLTKYKDSDVVQASKELPVEKSYDNETSTQTSSIDIVHSRSAEVLENTSISPIPCTVKNSSATEELCRETESLERRPKRTETMDSNFSDIISERKPQLSEENLDENMNSRHKNSTSSDVDSRTAEGNRLSICLSPKLDQENSLSSESNRKTSNSESESNSKNSVETLKQPAKKEENVVESEEYLNSDKIEHNSNSESDLKDINTSNVLVEVDNAVSLTVRKEKTLCEVPAKEISSDNASKADVPLPINAEFIEGVVEFEEVFVEDSYIKVMSDHEDGGFISDTVASESDGFFSNVKSGSILEESSELASKFVDTPTAFPESDDKSVIKLDSSDESQTTIEILSASPDLSQGEIEIHTTHEDEDNVRLYSEDAIPTQFELELAIVDNNFADPLHVPIPEAENLGNRVNNYFEFGKYNQAENHDRESRKNSIENSNECSENDKEGSIPPSNYKKDNNLKGSVRILNLETSYDSCTTSIDSVSQGKGDNKMLIPKVDKSFYCSDLLVKEVLAAKETLRRCLATSKSEKDKTRPKTAAEKKQGSSFDATVFRNSDKILSKSEDSRDRSLNRHESGVKVQERSKTISDNRRKPEIVIKLERIEKRHSKPVVSHTSLEKKIKSKTSTSNESDKDSINPERRVSSVPCLMNFKDTVILNRERTTISLRNSRRSHPNLLQNLNYQTSEIVRLVEAESEKSKKLKNSTSRVLPSKLKKDILRRREREDQHPEEAIAISDNVITKRPALRLTTDIKDSSKMKSYKIPKLSGSKDPHADVTTETSEELAQKDSSKMPVLEPEVNLKLETASDRESSRSPPDITDQDVGRAHLEIHEHFEEKIKAMNTEVSIEESKNMNEPEVTVADIVNELAYHEKATIRHRRYCTLCERWFPTVERHRRHLSGYQHRHTELTQRRTVHALFMLFTGKPCPRLQPADVSRTDCTLGEPTPLQVAVQDITMGLNKPDGNSRQQCEKKKKK